MPSLGRDLRRVTFCSPDDTADGAGGATRVWTDEFTVNAGFFSENAREMVKAGTLTDSEVVTLTILESVAALTITHRWSALIGGVRWNVRAVQRATGAPPHRLRVVVETGSALAD